MNRTLQVKCDLRFKETEEVITKLIEQAFANITEGL